MSQLMRSWMFVVALGAGCYAGEVDYRASSAAQTPDLVEVAPGVQVIADYDEPIFFADGSYWWSVDGLWYRSSSYTDGWSLMASPPMVVLNIREPLLWRHYHPRHYVAYRRPVPIHQVHRPVHHEPRPNRTPSHDRQH